MGIVTAIILHSSVLDIIQALYTLGPTYNRRIAYYLKENESAVRKKLLLMEEKGIVSRKGLVWKLDPRWERIAPMAIQLNVEIEKIVLADIEQVVMA